MKLICKRTVMAEQIIEYPEVDSIEELQVAETYYKVLEVKNTIVYADGEVIYDSEVDYEMDVPVPGL